MTTTRRMEDISIAYLSALAAQASLDFQTSTHDEDSVDCQIKCEFERDGQPFRSVIHIQLKSTASKNYYSIGENSIKYQLKKKNYDDLRKDGILQLILCLLILPDESEKPWVECTDDKLLMHGRMYWCSLRNRPAATQKARVPIELPKDQLLDPETLKLMMQRVARGELF